MAKRSYNNSAGRRPHGEKPYDPNNSFVKKMATKMTDLIPQRSWISKWFNSPISNGELTNEEADNNEEHNVEDQCTWINQPPSKRPRILIDVTHPPGTFTIQPRNRNLNEHYGSVRDDTVDFLDNEAPGPSGLRKFASSTPAMRIEMRNSMDNLIGKEQNNCNTNGNDENSESGESTSGCSSLIPQASRQDVNSQFNRKRINDNNDYMNNLKSSRSLFIESISGNRESMSSKRPSFNASYVNNDASTLTNVLSSPFYNGNITFGGSNAIGTSAMRRNRKNLAGNCDYQLRIPRRSSVKPTNAVNDSSGMSQTAKRILDALEHFSSPIADAKKIPIKSTLSTSFGKKRGRDEAFDSTQTSRVGLRHLTRELAVPTVPDMLKLKRRQRLQDTTLAARRIITAHSEPPPKQQSSSDLNNQEAEYHLRNENESQKYFGKILRAKSKKKPDIEQQAEAVNLPSIKLPITSLPSFDIPLPKRCNSTGITTATIETKSTCKTFKFSSPIKLEKNSTSPVKSINHFTFSKPLTLDSNDRQANEIKDTKKSIQTPSNNFVWTGSSTAPRPKEIKKPDKKDDTELKTGSVMDILGNNFNKTITNIWECSECFIKNNHNEEHCIACKNPRINDTCNKSTNLLPSSGISDNQFGAKFKMSSDKWECKCCSVRNPIAEDKCMSCMTPRVVKKIEKIESIKLSQKSEINKSDIMEKFKPAKDSWECPGCMLRNPSSVISCPCCNASKPGLLKTPAPEKPGETKPSLLTTNSTVKKWECPSCLVRNDAAASTCVCCTTPNPSGSVQSSVGSKTTSGFGDKFKAPVGSWSCDSCMVQNKSDAVNCVACGGLKPGAVKPKADDSAKFSFGIPSTGTQKFTFGIPPNSGKEDKSKAEAPSGFTFGVPTTQTTSFTFGIPTTTAGEAPKPSGFTFAAPKSVEPFKSDEKKGDIQTLFNNVNDTKVGFSFSNPTETKPKAPKDSNKVSPAEKTESPPTISFLVASNDTKTTATAAIAPTQPVFSFSEPKSSTSASTPVMTFGQSSASIQSGITNTPTPTETVKAAETPSTESQAQKPLIFGKPAPAFTETAEAKPVLTFGASINNQDKPVFPVENKLPSFGTIETKTAFGNTGDKPLFNAPTPAPAFGVPTPPATTAPTTSATTGLFASSSSGSVFGSTAPSFGAPSSSASATIFSSVKPAEAPANSEIFTFGKSQPTQPAAQPAATTSFNFPSGNNPGTANFSFFGNQPTPQQPISFGSYGEHKPPAEPIQIPVFGFNSQKSVTSPPVFGQTTANPITNMFGNQPSSASSFGTLSSAGTSGAFNFGTPSTTPATATPSSASTSGGFNFAGSAPGAAAPGTPSTGFSFNAPAQPSFNFTGGNAPTAFSATPQAAATPPQRKIKKAVRRMPPRT